VNWFDKFMSLLNYKVQSRLEWSRETSQLTTEEIQLGAVLRIADATESMAANYTRLQDELDRYKRWYAEEKNAGKRLSQSNASLRGHLGRMKRLLSNVQMSGGGARVESKGESK
jgi:hypothetical protein